MNGGDGHGHWWEHGDGNLFVIWRRTPVNNKARCHEYKPNPNTMGCKRLVNCAKWPAMLLPYMGPGDDNAMGPGDDDAIGPDDVNPMGIE